jgi:hypothetical protein
LPDYRLGISYVPAYIPLVQNDLAELVYIAEKRGARSEKSHSSNYKTAHKKRGKSINYSSLSKINSSL